MSKVQIYKFFSGAETATLPTAGTPTDASDVATKAWVDAVAGGGGSSLKWFNDDGDGPNQLVKYHHNCWEFVDGLTQPLYAILRVPTVYGTGSPIKIKLYHFHEASSTTQLLLAQSTLISSGAAFDSTTNQRTTTNVATAGASKVLVPCILDVTSSIGQINGGQCGHRGFNPS